MGVEKMGNCVYDVLIIFRDGTEKVVESVKDYDVVEEAKCFAFTKNNYRGFVPMDEVRFFGRRFDYENER